MIFLTIALLVVMEVSLSFDNAIVNASVLRNMSETWRHRFLVYGLPIAVFGTRLVLPVAIVAIASGLGMIEVFNMAWSAPEEYSARLIESHTAISSFGGVFLLMVFFNYMLSGDKEHHWLPFERYMACNINGIGAALVCAILLALQYAIPEAHRLDSLFAGVIGLLTYLAVKGVMGDGHGVAASGLTGFIYLEVLDASFSLDGVIAAFAMTNNIIVIMIGLGIGAGVIRSMTISLVRKGTLEEYQYLEHGAHWGIGSLGFLILASTLTPIPELVTGLVALGFIGASFLSSLKAKAA
ncbi:MAG: DUF475 domain-containing protein [Sterolibacterium sp.]